MRETRVRSLGQEDPLEKEMATHSSILAWRIPRTEEPGGCSPRGHRVGHDWVTLLTYLVCVYSVLDASYASPLILNKAWEEGTDHLTDKREAQKG